MHIAICTAFGKHDWAKIYERERTMKYVCDVCGWEYDEEKGYPEGGIAPGTKWEDVPDDSNAQSALWVKESSQKNK